MTTEFIVAILTAIMSLNLSFAETQKNSIMPPGKIKLSYAEKFRVEYLDQGLKIVTDSDGKQMLLVPRGKEVPDIYKSLPQLNIPLTETAFTSSTQVGFLRAFADSSVYDSIIGFGQKSEDIAVEEIAARARKGLIKNFGGHNQHEAFYNFEILQDLNPKLVFAGYGMKNEQIKLQEMLKSAGIPFLVDGSGMEKDYRGTFEWVKFYAAFYDYDQKAADFYEKGIQKIDQIQQRLVEVKDKPKVGWGLVSMGRIYVENGGSKTAQMIRDAGGVYIFDDIGPKRNSATSISIEDFYERFSHGGIFIDRGLAMYGPDKKSMIEQLPILADLPCFKNNQVWKVSHNFWSSYHDIDKKYLELAAIFHPELFPDVTFEHFYLLPDVKE